MKEQASAEITEDDLLQDEPDVSIGEESQEQVSYFDLRPWKCWLINSLEV